MIAQRRKRRRGGISLHLSALKENKATRRGEIRKRKQDGKTFRGRSRRKMDEEFPSYRQNGKFRREKSRKWKRDTAGRSIREEGGRMKILGSRWWLCQGKRKREAYGTFCSVVFWVRARNIGIGFYGRGEKVAGGKKALTNFSEQCGKSLLHGP